MAKEINKIVYNGNVLIDLTADSITADDVINGKTFHAADGTIQTGTSTYDADTKDATVFASEMLIGKTAYKSGEKVTGSMPNRGKQTGSITSKNQKVNIQNGFHDGSGEVGIDATEQTKIVGDNIRKGVTILGVIGTMEEETENPQVLDDVIPSAETQTFTPDEGYTCFREVTVKPVPYNLTDNEAGGQTATIL